MGGKLPAIIALLSLSGVMAVFGLQQDSSLSAKYDVLPDNVPQIVQGDDLELQQVKSVETENARSIEETRSNQIAEPSESEEFFPAEQGSKEALIALGRQQRLHKAAERGEVNEFLSAEEEREQKHKERERLRQERIRYVKEQKTLRYERLQAYRERVRSGEEGMRPDLSPVTIPEDLKR